jgi:hypothetical protein
MSVFISFDSGRKEREILLRICLYACVCGIQCFLSSSVPSSRRMPIMRFQNWIASQIQSSGWDGKVDQRRQFGHCIVPYLRAIWFGGTPERTSKDDDLLWTDGRIKYAGMLHADKSSHDERTPQGSSAVDGFSITLCIIGPSNVTDNTSWSCKK